jgi:ubiquinone/menaquinone biosynthesis C-methylase UbiE
MTQNSIQNFFDVLSVERDVRLEREPLLKYEAQMRQQAVFELMSPTADELILDVGCGNARDMRCLIPLGCQSVGVDISIGMLREGAQTIQDLEGSRLSGLVMADALHLPFPSGTFDKIECSEVIEHIPEWTQAITEMSRVLKPGSKLVITTPNKFGIYGLWQAIFGPIVSLAKKALGRCNHPYDEWKVQKEVVRELKLKGFVIVDRLGVCFYPIPSFMAHHLLPRWLAQLSVEIVHRFEPYLRRRFHQFGYMMAISAIKGGENL